MISHQDTTPEHNQVTDIRAELKRGLIVKQQQSLVQPPPNLSSVTVVSRHWYKDWEWPDQLGKEGNWLTSPLTLLSWGLKTSSFVQFTENRTRSSMTTTNSTRGWVQLSKVTKNSWHIRFPHVSLVPCLHCCVHAYLLQHEAVSSQAVERLLSSVCIWALSAPISCRLPLSPHPYSDPPIYPPVPPLPSSHRIAPRISVLRAGANRGRVRHFLCDRKPTTNTQRPWTWGGGG